MESPDNILDLQREAESGNVAAQAILGISYLYGINVQVNHKEAFRLLSVAATKRLPRAMAALAHIYADGLGVAADLPKAMELYLAAAKAGEFYAQIELARIYAKGNSSVSANSVEALRWYKAAVAQEVNIVDCEELTEAKNYVTKSQ